MSILKKNQSIFDYVTQSSGSILSIVDFCDAQDFSITQILDKSVSVAEWSTDNRDVDVANYYSSKNIELATNEEEVITPTSSVIGECVVGEAIIQ